VSTLQFLVFLIIEMLSAHLQTVLLKASDFQLGEKVSGQSDFFPQFFQEIFLKVFE